MESPITSQCCKLQLFTTQKLSGQPQQPGRLDPDLELDCFGVLTSAGAQSKSDSCRGSDDTDAAWLTLASCLSGQCSCRPANTTEGM